MTYLIFVILSVSEGSNPFASITAVRFFTGVQNDNFKPVILSVSEGSMALDATTMARFFAVLRMSVLFTHEPIFT